MSGDFQAAMRRLLWFVVGLLISAVWLIPTARAETCTATVCTQAAIVGTTSPAVQRWTSGNGAGGNWAYATQADYNRLCGSITPSGTKIAEPTNLSNGANIATGQYCVIGGSHYNAGVSFAAICNESWGGPGRTVRIGRRLCLHDGHGFNLPCHWRVYTIREQLYGWLVPAAQRDKRTVLVWQTAMWPKTIR